MINFEPPFANMADQCIVCLEDLDVVPDAFSVDLQDAASAAGPSTILTTPHPGDVDNQQQIALIKPCGHTLHDECLRMWSQKANSCPICRHAFNLVEVLDKVGGKFPCAFVAISPVLSADYFMLCFSYSEVVGVVW
jgi:hypothetical protein